MSNKPLAHASHLRLIDKAPFVVAWLLILDSLHFVFARLLLPYLPPSTSSLYVLGIATVEMVFLIAVWDRIHFDVFRRHVWFFLSVGFLVAGSTVLTYVAVVYVDPGTASLLGKSSILFAIGFGLIWLQERLTLLEAVGGFVAITGLFIITFQPGDYLRLGSLIVLASAVMYALHTALVKRYGGGMRLVDFFLFRVVCTTAFLFLLAASRGELLWPGPQAWLLLLLVGTVDIVFSRGLYYLALRRLNLSIHSIILTVSPVATIGWTLLLFGVRPTLQQMIGGVGVMAGVFLVMVSRARINGPQGGV